MTDIVANIGVLELEFEPEVPQLERSVVSELEFEALCVAIARLPNECREAFVLRKVYQYSYEEIAEYCGAPVSAVKNHVRKGFTLVQSYREER